MPSLKPHISKTPIPAKQARTARKSTTQSTFHSTSHNPTMASSRLHTGILRLCLLVLVTLTGTFGAAIENVEVAARDYAPPPPPTYGPPPPPTYGPPPTHSTCVPSYILSYATQVSSVPVIKTYTIPSTSTGYSYATHVATVPIYKTFTILSTSTGYNYTTQVSTIPVVKTLTGLKTSTGYNVVSSVKTVSISTCSPIKPTVPTYGVPTTKSTTTSKPTVPVYTPPVYIPTPIHY